METKTFKELYAEERKKDAERTTCAQIFIKRVAGATLKSEATVRAWLAGVQTPDDLAQTIIAEELGVAKAGLFPSKNK